MLSSTGGNGSAAAMSAFSSTSEENKSSSSRKFSSVAGSAGGFRGLASHHGGVSGQAITQENHSSSRSVYKWPNAPI